MLRIFKSLTLVLVALLAAFHADSAHAQWPWLGYTGLNGSPAAVNLAFQSRTPPYFAIHPPVYYGATIHRAAYGSSPYAQSSAIAPCCTRTAGYEAPVSQAAGMMIENPYYRVDSAADVPASPLVAPPAGVLLPPMAIPSAPIAPAPGLPTPVVPGAVVPRPEGVLPAPVPGVKPQAPAPPMSGSEAKTVVNPFVSPSRS